ncbi:MAG TPA: hypothetical protein ENG87_01920 [Candidatus Pacearchaeota archaeon]|nr:hypothetical protein BMS3Abin17_00122 [archaeon BMS3Abin17]HDK42110.1 hypothetical protein [Candidatus Pacearchaeota archaeon]HDZ60137.1 hypothetical protein [Candidatus Pacearchaeota archaeon]
MSLSDKRKEYFEKEFSELRNDGLQLATIKRIEFIQKKVQEQDKQSIKEIEKYKICSIHKRHDCGCNDSYMMISLKNIKQEIGKDLCEDKGDK